MISNTVGMGKSFGTGGNGTGRRVSGIMMIQMRPHRADVVERSGTKGTSVTMLPMMLP